LTVAVAVAHVSDLRHLNRLSTAAPLSSRTAGKEEKLEDYTARKSNVAASELAMWDEELSLHSVDVAEAEASVHRQRTLEWELRQDDKGWATVMQAYKFPFVQSPSKELK